MKDYIVFTVSSNKKLAKDFAKFWNCALGKVEISKFEDGEVLVKPISDVKDKDVIIIESTARKVNDSVFNLLMLLDAIHRLEPKSVTLIVPYLGYSRQERINNPNEPISCEIMAKVLETASYDKLMTFDIHHPGVSKFFSRGIKNIPTTDVFAAYFSNYFKENNINIKDVVVVSPDKGSNSRVDLLLFKFFGAKKVVLEKIRPTADRVEHNDISLDVNGKVCIILDDIISTGRTIASSVKVLRSKGAKTILVAATHGVFAKGAVDIIKKAGAKEIIVTNTIEQEKNDKVTYLDVLSLLSENI